MSAFDAGKHFVQVLAENGRLELLPEVSAQFEILRLQLESSAIAYVESAMEMTEAQQATLSEALAPLEQAGESRG